MNLFVYGTLRSLPLLRAVGGTYFRHGPAQLAGYAVRQVQGDIVPMIEAAPGAKADGLLLRDITPEAKARFDLYEGAWGYTLTEVTVTTDEGEVQAQVYLPPDSLVPEGDWSLDAWEAQNGVAAMIAATEVFDRDPWPTPAELRVILPMAEKRAWARLRAEERQAPATLRADHDRLRANHKVVQRWATKPTQGHFFAIRAQDVSHDRFDGGRNEDLPREVFIGIDAALVLPYDPVADTVLLVEQVRMGPFILGEGNPWTLEPVAGMVDARETPEEAALREAQEEAELTDLDLRQMFSFYASPGSSTDYFYCYLGLTDLGAPRSYLGGLEAEAEDLRLHIVPFDQAMELAQTGEITAGPLLTMLYWLLAHRPSLRAGA